MATASAGIYRPRHPERTVLYRVVAQHFDRFVQVYDERFAPTRGPLPRGICPSCHMKRELIWAEWAAGELLEQVPHRQVVFTIPKRLRPYFRYQRSLLGNLAGCAWRALQLWVLAYYEDEAAVPGAVGFIQTSGELLNFHPHVHLLTTDGVFDRDGAFERFTFFDTQLIERLFRAEVLRLLTGKGLISQEVVANLLSWRHSGFSVHADVKVADRQAAARLGRYMIRCPVVLERMSLDEDTGEVIYRTRLVAPIHPWQVNQEHQGPSFPVASGNKRFVRSGRRRDCDGAGCGERSHPRTRARVDKLDREHLLRFAVLENHEVVGAEALDEPAAVVGDDDVDADARDRRLECRSLLSNGRANEEEAEDRRNRVLQPKGPANRALEVRARRVAREATHRQRG